MASVIGLRVYRIIVHKRGTRAETEFASNLISKHPQTFVEEFFDKHASPTQENIAQRSWYIEKIGSKDTEIKGYIRYGTYGFESNFIDSQTKKQKYSRKTTDVEEIPLFLKFWFPKRHNFGLVAFQSFQGRSCVTLLVNKIKNDFENYNREYSISFNKLTPSSLKGTSFYKSPIKRVRFIGRNTSSDLADRFLGANTKNELVDIEYTVSAKKNKSLGPFNSFFSKISHEKGGIIEHDGIEFSEASADVKFGNKTRKVGVFGPNSDIGVIDISNDVKIGLNGHPTLESLELEVDSMLKDFYQALKR